MQTQTLWSNQMIRELIDTEVEAVVGGGSFDVFNVANVAFQNAQAFGGNALAIGGSATGGPAVAFNTLSQANQILNG
jgi:hypothetical protein